MILEIRAHTGKHLPLTMAELLEARVETIASGGAGLAYIDGKTVFIKGGLPGERLVCRITKDHRSWAEAEILELLDVSTDRVKPVCGVYGICGGCNLQHLDYKAQLAAKTAILKDALVRIGGIRPPEPVVIPSEPLEYRNRMQFHTIRERGKKSSAVLWGLKSGKSASIVPISDCPIADPGIRKVLREQEKKPLLAPLGKDRFTVYSRGDLFLGEGGISRGKTRILDKELTLDASLFFQSNGAMLEKLVADLLAAAGEADRSMPMADLFCGVGTFAAFLGQLFSGTSLVEENKAAIALARENLAAVRGDFFAQRGEDWIKHNNPRRFGFIIVDPPRQGLCKSLAARLAAEGPPLLAYVSCDPATLARDSKILTAEKYNLKALRFYDFYPQTAHIESLALFVK